MVTTIALPRPDAAPAEVVERTVEVLRAGGVVVLPTDTVYGLAALPSDAAATARLFDLKGRGRDVPIAVLCATPGDALALAAPAAVTDEVRRIAGRLWPGPLTLVLPRRPGLGYALGAPEDTIGVRCPDHAFVRAVAAAVGPLATTSANPHGAPTPATAEEAAGALGPVDLVVDGGRCSAPPSTVVDATAVPWRVRREGPLSLDDVRAAAADRV